MKKKCTIVESTCGGHCLVHGFIQALSEKNNLVYANNTAHNN